MKTTPISFRPSAGLDRRLDLLRARTGLAKSQLIEALADEAERARRYPGLAFRGPDHRRRPWLIGCPFDVWEVIQAWQDLGRDERRLRQALRLTGRQVRLALAYYREFETEVDEVVLRARRTPTDLAAEYPFIEALSVSE